MMIMASGLSKRRTIFIVFSLSIISEICLTRMAVPLIFSRFSVLLKKKKLNVRLMMTAMIHQELLVMSHAQKCPLTALQIQTIKFTEVTIENAVEIDLKHSGSSPLPFFAGGLAIIGVSTGIMLYKKKK